VGVLQEVCDERAGEKIYKTYTGVKSVLVVKPLPPASEKDLFDQYWYGDPYSDATPWSKRGISAATTLTLNSRRPDRIQKGFEFVEVKLEDHGPIQYKRIPVRHRSTKRPAWKTSQGL
jgi:hypothetical protein